jgi:hypothetical protein
MSADRYDVEYHLTPRGWEEGTAYFYGDPQGVVPVPKDAVLTLLKETFQSSPFSKDEVSWSEKWRSSQKTDIELLQKKFGARP